MFAIFKIKLHLHWILFSLHKEIIEHSYSLWFPIERAPTVILHTLHPTEAEYSNRVEANNKAIFEWPGEFRGSDRLCGCFGRT